MQLTYRVGKGTIRISILFYIFFSFSQCNYCYPLLLCILLQDASTICGPNDRDQA